MAFSAHKDAEQLRERFEASADTDKKAQVLADQIRKSKHFIAFTGAGISTSAGIPDFRGPQGVWTLRAQGKQRTSKTVSTLQAIPTPTHMALVALQDKGLLKYLVSQNCDGLHRKSGMLPDRISELHGNSNREYCKKCGKEYIRDFRAVASYAVTVRDHRTGRKCAVCGGELHDSIINFGENLPRQPLERAYKNAEKADLCLVLGSSLTVSPANNIPEVVGERKSGKLAICNLQKTPLDHLASLRVHSKTDDLMIGVMEKLGIEIPPFILRRRLRVEVRRTGKDGYQLRVMGVDVDCTPASFLRSVQLDGSIGKREPYIFNFRGDPSELNLELEFMGHYGEPNLELVHHYNEENGGECVYLLEYNPANGEWKTTEEGAVELGDGIQVDTQKQPGSRLRSSAGSGGPGGNNSTAAVDTSIGLEG